MTLLPTSQIETVTCPLFPLPLVLFPGGRLPLQIFEARYLDMIRQCMREQSGFVVTMARNEGFSDLGCEVAIADFDQLDNGLLGVLCVGQQKMQLFNPRQQDDGLWIAEAAPVAVEPSRVVEETHQVLVDLLANLQRHPAVSGLYQDIDHTDAFEVGARLTELLPFDLETKQALFELADPVRRLTEIETHVRALELRGRR
ncbi:MAG: LON peptidase substrate-binding domain-containing protein [Litorivicinaceae bacterium]